MTWRNMKKLYSLLVISAMIIGLVFGLIIGRPDLSYQGFLRVGIPVIISILFIRLIVIDTNEFDFFVIHNQSLVNKMVKLYGILYSLSILALTVSPRRTLVYLFILSLCIFPLTIQALESANPFGLLIQFKIFILNLSYGLTLSYPLYYGWGDLISHINYSQIILTTGDLLPSSITHYANFPLYHISAAQATLLFNMDISTSIFLLMGAIFSTSIWAHYILTRSLTRSKHISLLSTCIFISLPLVIYYNAYVVTRAIVFISCLYILWLILETRLNDIRANLLYIIFVFYAMLTHQITIIQLLVVLLLMSIIFWRLGLSLPKFDKIIVIFGLPVLYWGYYSGEFIGHILLTRIIPTLTNTIEEASSEGTTQSVIHASYYLNNHIIVAISIISILYLISSENKKYVCLGYSAAFGTIIYFPSPITTLDISSVLLLQRFELFLTPLVAVVTAIGLLVILQNLNGSIFGRKLTGVFAAIFLIMFFITSMMASTGAPNTADIDEFDWTGPPLHFEETELLAMEFTSKHTIGSVHTDKPSERYLIQLGGFSAHEVTNTVDNDYLGERNVLIRDVHKKTFLNGNSPTQSRNNVMDLNNENRIKTFDNGDVSLYLTK